MVIELTREKDAGQAAVGAGLVRLDGAIAPRRQEWGETEDAGVHRDDLTVSWRRDNSASRQVSVLSRSEARRSISDGLLHLQSRILTRVAADAHAVIAVCSALEGEGKTTVAVSLAEMLSDQFNRQTLLVDANLKSPQVHSVLDTHVSPGLKDCLQAGAVMTNTIEWTGDMWVMPAGLGPATLTESHEDPRQLFAMLKSLFRLTIVDMPAFDSRQSTTMMPLWADAIVWVVKADSSPAPLVSNAMNLVDRDKILGVVLNGHRSRLPGWLDRLL